VITSGRSQEKLDALAAAFYEEQKVFPIMCDVRDEHSVASAWDGIMTKVGRIDVLVNNAGVTAFTPFVKSTIEDFDAIHSTNLRGAFLCTQKVLPGMIERGEGTIVMINSVASRDVFQNSSVYAAAKAGLKAMTDGLRLEVRGLGVRVISVYPGATNTPIWNDKVREKHSEKMMTPENIADVVLSAVRLPKSVLVEDLYVQPIGGAL
jgi:NADP-dependent 3-hydroxy acid dehydrogenase YdfG